MQQQAARAAAKRLYQKISFSGGPLQSYQVSSLLTDAYEYLQIPFKPTSNDVKGMAEVLDLNKDGKVTLEDLENLAVQFLCGPGVLTPNSFDVSFKKPKYEASSVSTSYETSYAKPDISYKESFQKPSGKPSQKLSKNNSIYNEEGEAYLRATREIFQAYADSRYTITASEVPEVLSKTYETLGRKGYKPNNEDVKVWMKLCDGNEDGHVEYEEYEYFVVRSLERSAISIYKW